MERWLIGLPSVSNQTGDKIDEKVGRAAVACVFNPGDIMELVNDSLNDETFYASAACLQERRVDFACFLRIGRDRQRAVCRHQLQFLSEELFKERFGEKAAVADQLPPQPFDHLWDRFTVIGVGGRELNRQQVTMVIDKS